MRYIQQHPIITLISALMLYSIVWVLMTGHAGFSGDEWRILHIAYWLDFPENVSEYLTVSGRPLQIIHQLALFEAIGFRDIPSNFLTLLVHLISVLGFGMVLWQSNPDDKLL
ncbi:MAG: hypothetical protein AAFV93_18175, partial [Chloroflexota bacterium]